MNSALGVDRAVRIGSFLVDIESAIAEAAEHTVEEWQILDVRAVEDDFSVAEADWFEAGDSGVFEFDLLGL